MPSIDKKDRLLEIVAEYKSLNRLDDLIQLFNTALDSAQEEEPCCISSKTNCSHSGKVDKDAVIEQVMASIKTYLGPNILALDPEESITIPDSEEFVDFNEGNTIHVDGFLYDDDDVDALVDEGKIKRNQCLSCGSLETVPTNFVSHSMVSCIFLLLLLSRFIS
jgi:soluble cytochrome b562